MKKWIAYLQDITQSNQIKNPPKREDFLKKSIKDACRSLDDAYQGMQNVNDPELIDRYIYEWKAANLRYGFLMHEMKNCQLSELGASDSSASISSTNRETETSLLNRSFK